MLEEAQVLVVDSGADPWVVAHDGSVYYCFVIDDAAVYVRRAASVEGIGQGRTAQVWRPPVGGLHTLWAPELHHLDGRWYVYVAGDEVPLEGRAPSVRTHPHHRMHVLVADDALGPYELLGKIATPDDHWAIDGTVFERLGRRYFVWSGWPEHEGPDERQALYVAEMDTPWSVVGERVQISAPELGWETRTMAVNEGPAVLRRGERETTVVYSASHSLTDDYCLGRLDLVGEDPLDPAAWAKHPEPVLASHDGMYSTGHASFVFDDDVHGWIAFHTARHSGAGWDRQVRVTPAAWHPEGTLVLGEAARVRPDPSVGRVLPGRAVERVSRTAPGSGTGTGTDAVLLAARA